MLDFLTYTNDLLILIAKKAHEDDFIALFRVHTDFYPGADIVMNYNAAVAGNPDLLINDPEKDQDDDSYDNSYNSYDSYDDN